MAGPFRIRTLAPRVIPFGAHAEHAELSQDGAMAQYTDRLMRMIPGGVVALYLTGAGVIPKEGQSVGLPIWSLVCLIGLVVVRAAGSRDKMNGRGPQWASVALSAGAFVVWLYALGGPFVAWNVHYPYVGSLLIMAYTFFVPFVYRGDWINPDGA